VIRKITLFLAICSSAAQCSYADVWVDSSAWHSHGEGCCQWMDY